MVGIVEVRDVLLALLWLAGGMAHSQHSYYETGKKWGGGGGPALSLYLSISYDFLRYASSLTVRSRSLASIALMANTKHMRIRQAYARQRHTHQNTKT